MIKAAFFLAASAAALGLATLSAAQDNSEAAPEESDIANAT